MRIQVTIGDRSVVVEQPDPQGDPLAALNAVVAAAGRPTLRIPSEAELEATFHNEYLPRWMDRFDGTWADPVGHRFGGGVVTWTYRPGGVKRSSCVDDMLKRFLKNQREMWLDRARDALA